MKKLLLIVAATWLFVAGAAAQNRADYEVIPLPREINIAGGKDFALKSTTKIVYPAGNDMMRRNAAFLAEYIEFATGLRLEITDKSRGSDVIVLNASLPESNRDAYRISINGKRVVISGASEAGNFYGIQTLRKSIPVNSEGRQVLLPAVTINDFPEFGYRGMHLDVARHTFSVEFVKSYIDILALHNINVLHWHLTDDQGWRIEIKRYPLLTEVGSVRNETLVGHLGWKPNKYDGKPYGGYFTQEQARDIVAYAAERHITVIPEVDLPGHMLAALASYPQLGCTGGPYEVWGRWGVSDQVLCVGKEETFEFLEGVYSEIMDIFPSKYIHIGGDECPKSEWQKCPACQARIKELGLVADGHHSAEEMLQSYTIKRIEKFLNDHGRAIIGWDEILEGGIAPNATIMSWRGMEGAEKAASMGHDAVLVPKHYFYFNYYQSSDQAKEPLAQGHFVPVDKTYGFQPYQGIAPENRKHILGVQGCAWTEYIDQQWKMLYMVLPRMDALAEVQWTDPATKDYEGFLRRLGGNMRAIYDKYGWRYATHVFDE